MQHEPAALVAECAGEQGRFAEFVGAVHAGQDSLGLKPWWEYARTATVHDSLRYVNCLRASPPSRIAAGRAWAEHLGLTGTPTVIVNRWLLSRPPDTKELLRIIESIKSGRPPFDLPE